MNTPESKWNSIAIVATTKSTFAGAATIKCRFLEYLHNLGCKITLIVEDIPPAYKKMNSTYSLNIVNPSKAKSASQEAKELLYNYIIEEIVAEAKDYHSKGQKVIIWGSHMFPYGCACLKAKEILRNQGIVTSLILFPVGADIWEIGKDTPITLIDLLNSTEVDFLATYSQKFSEEIKVFLNSAKSIECVPPFINENLFRKFTIQEKNKRRKELGLEKDSLIFINHSNMRPVKRLDFTIMIADEIAKLRQHQPCHLLLIGPKIPSLPIISLSINIHQIDTINDVETYLPIADFCINTSLHDSFNTALLESMSCGVPTITSDRPAIAEVIRENGAGVVFNTHIQSKDLQSEIYGDYPISSTEYLRLINQISKLTEIEIKKMQDLGQRTISENYSLSSGTKHLRNLILKAVSEKE
ncbi:MAG: N-acetyl-alpha-D-glucosaminyl L-malate synthase [Bacteroidetes bacterium]|nr:N-acetyl-alpha-D-glucosaminyl L-malate synthase [Bacteroidota bacterium]